MSLDAVIDMDENRANVDESTGFVATLNLGTEHFKTANERIRAALEANDDVVLDDVTAQRYIGCALPYGKHIDIYGVPGNDMACYMDGGTIEVFGNAQDQIANTMNDGRIIVHGRCGDAAGYAMRGGQMFIRDDVGWRVGIHMKQYNEKCPTIVIGGNAGCFLGEYMAGGIIVLLGTPGAYLATGMHGGKIFLKEKPADDLISGGLVCEEVDDDDARFIGELLDKYKEYFSNELETDVDVNPKSFYRLTPESTRPYANLYAS